MILLSLLQPTSSHTHRPQPPALPQAGRGRTWPPPSGKNQSSASRDGSRVGFRFRLYKIWDKFIFFTVLGFTWYVYFVFFLNAAIDWYVVVALIDKYKFWSVMLLPSPLRPQRSQKHSLEKLIYEYTVLFFFCQLYENIKCFFYLAANSILSEKHLYILGKIAGRYFYLPAVPAWIDSFVPGASMPVLSYVL